MLQLFMLRFLVAILFLNSYAQDFTKHTFTKAEVQVCCRGKYDLFLVFIEENLKEEEVNIYSRGNCFYILSDSMKMFVESDNVFSESFEPNVLTFVAMLYESSNNLISIQDPHFSLGKGIH